MLTYKSLVVPHSQIWLDRAVIKRAEASQANLGVLSSSSIPPVTIILDAPEYS